MFIKLSMNVMPLEATPPLYVYCPTTSNTKMAATWTSEVLVTLMPLYVGSWNCVMINLWKICSCLKVVFV